MWWARPALAVMGRRPAGAETSVDRLRRLCRFIQLSKNYGPFAVGPERLDRVETGEAAPQNLVELRPEAKRVHTSGSLPVGQSLAAETWGQLTGLRQSK
jgi:hypothetical protein